MSTHKENEHLRVWCNKHNCKPGDCFKLHHPEAYNTSRVKTLITAKEQEDEIKELHLKKQLENEKK